MTVGRESLGERLRAMRKRASLTSQELASAIGTTQGHVCAIETGRIKNPRYKLLMAIADYFEMTLSELVGETSNPESTVQGERVWRKFELIDDTRSRDTIEQMLDIALGNTHSNA